MERIRATIRMECERLCRGELSATFRFFAILLVLVVLPDRELDVLFGVNPRLVWLVVVFIAGLSFLGYLLATVLDPARAISLTAILGGCVSPSLTIMSLAEQSRRYPEFTLVYAFAAAIASTVLFPRMLILVGIVSPSLALSLAIPLLTMTGVGLVVMVLLWLRIRTEDTPAIELDTPFQTRPALAFGAVIGLLLMAMNLFDLSVPSTVVQTGVVLAVVADSLGNVGIAWAAGARKMAWVIGVILVMSSSIGVSIIFLF